MSITAACAGTGRSPLHLLGRVFVPVGLPVALVLLVAPAGLQAQGSGAGAGAVVVATLAEVIHPISAEFIVDAVADAERRNAELLILRLNTPGGLDSSMRTIVQAMLGSRVPICLFVGPSGARAASAGFFMAMAADVVAMAPGTNMGAASPVPIGGGTVDETMANKLMQDAEAYMRSLAEQHGRPADLAAEAVADGRSFRASEALESGLADLVVDDIGDLLSALDGWVLQRREGEVTLNLASSERIELELSLRQRILAILANPRVAYMLMLIGLGGIYFELSTPGAVLPGVLGAISLVLALLAFQVLPISFAGLALILLALVFFVIEIKVTSYGLLTVAGLVSFVLGSLMLVPGPIPEMRLGLGFVLPVAIVVAGLAGFLLWLVVGAHRGQVRTGTAGLVHELGEARIAFGPGERGSVFVHGELWRARSDSSVRAGDTVEVLAVSEGMVVEVRVSQDSTPD